MSDTEIIVHLSIVVSSNGTLAVRGASYELGGDRKTRTHIDPAEVIATAAAFVHVRTKPDQVMPADASPAAGVPLFMQPGPKLFDDQHTRPCGVTHTPPPTKAGPVQRKLPSAEDAVTALMGVGVTVSLARQVVTPATARRACELAKWMADQQNIRSPDAVLRKMMRGGG